MSIGQRFSKLALAGGAAAAFAAAPALAQEEAPSINDGSVSFQLGLDIPTIYIFRGYEQEDTGLILQPYAQANFAVKDGVTFYVGTWNSIHENETGSAAGDANDEWYESDFYAGFAIDEFLDDRVSIDISYIHYLYPSNTFGDYKEIDLAISFDDSELFGDWAFSPYVLFAFEFDTTGAGDTDDIYAEIGGELAFSVVESEDYPIDLTVPITIGLSVDDYYLDAGGDDETFGYLSIGANFGMPLSFIPAEYGSWSAGAGLTLYFLNDDVVGLDDGDNDDFNLVGTLGVAMEY